VALWYHAAQAADSAAADGAAAAARFGGGTGVGAAAVARFAAEAGVRLEAERVEGEGIDMVASATVRVPHVLPFWPSTVTRSARAPVERLTEVAGG
jgi:hypothetical protein